MWKPSFVAAGPTLHRYIITFTRPSWTQSSLGTRAMDLYKDVHIRSVHDDVSEPRAAPDPVCSCSHGYITPAAGSCPVPVPVPAVSTLGIIFCISWIPAASSPQADLHPYPGPVLPLYLTFPRQKAKCLMSFFIHSYIHTLYVCVEVWIVKDLRPLPRTILMISGGQNSLHHRLLCGDSEYLVT